MTEQPPVIPENPQDSGGDVTPPTPTEQAEAQTQAEVQIQTPLNMNDHVTYAQALYQQPSWVVESVFVSGSLDRTRQYTQAEVQGAIDTMMATPDSTFEQEAPQ